MTYSGGILPSIVTAHFLLAMLNYSHYRNPRCARTDAQTNPSAQRATQLWRVLACVYSVSRQN
jgi:hypothetical protein